MKRYAICLFLFLGVSAACLAAGAVVTRYHEDVRVREESMSIKARQEIVSTEQTLPESAEAANRNQITHETGMIQEEYYLVCEDGFLLVFLKDRKTICLYTHIPIADFPMKEQDRLREGIWFSGMMEVFNYLESYTS